MGLDVVDGALPADPEGALGGALHAWRARRAVELEELVGALGAWVGRALPPLGEVDHEGWMAVAAAARPADLDRLLASLLTPPANSLRLRIEALRTFAPDPRMGPVLLAMVEAPPTTSSSNFGAWTALFDLLPGCVDTRVAGRLTARAEAPGGTSQFWPKLTKWCLTARDRLVDPPVLTGAERDRVAGMVAEVADLGPARFELEVEASASGSAPVAGVGLADAVTAVEAGDLERALDIAVTVWGSVRDPALAEPIDRLGAMLPAEPMPGTNPKARHAVWMERARDPRPSEIGALIAGLGDGQAALLEEKLSMAVRWLPDPRVCRQLETYFTDFSLGARDRLWAAIHDGLVHHADPRRAQAFEARRLKYWEPHPLNRSMAIRKHVRRTAEAWLAALRDEELTDAQRAQVQQIDAALDRLAAREAGARAGDADAEARLVRAVLDDPEGSASLRIYADWLIERGDPRGELIVLEQELLAGKKVKGRRDALAKQEDALLGPVGKLVAPYPRRWAGGVLQQATLAKAQSSGLAPTERAAAVADLRWALIRKLVVGDGDLEVVRGAPLWGLEEIAVPSQGLAALAARSEALPRLRALEIRPASTNPAEYEALDAVRPHLPALTSIAILIWDRDGERSAPPARFFQSPALRGVTLTSGGPGAGGLDEIAAWVERLIAAGSPCPRVTWHGTASGEAVRGADGGYAVKVEFALHNAVEGERVRAIVRGLRAAPLSALEVSWEGTKKGVREQFADVGAMG